MKKLALVAAGIVTLTFSMGAEGACDDRTNRGPKVPDQEKPNPNVTLINPNDLPLQPKPTEMVGDNPAGTDPIPGRDCNNTEHDIMHRTPENGWVKCMKDGDTWRWRKQ